MPSQQPSPTSPSNPNGPEANPGNAPSSAQDFGARAFVSKAMEGGMAEVQLGQLAQQKSQSNDVKQFAAKMANDHGQMGGRSGLSPWPSRWVSGTERYHRRKTKRRLKSFRDLSGDEFDREYITMMVKDHQKDLKEFKTEAQSAQDPTVKQIAEKGSQVIQQHLQIIEQIAKAHKSTSVARRCRAPSNVYEDPSTCRRGSGFRPARSLCA